MGTRCRIVEKYIKDEAPHKHLVFVLNKCDLVPTGVAVSVHSRFGSSPRSPGSRCLQKNQSRFLSASRCILIVEEIRYSFGRANAFPALVASGLEQMLVRSGYASTGSSTFRFELRTCLSSMATLLVSSRTLLALAILCCLVVMRLTLRTGILGTDLVHRVSDTGISCLHHQLFWQRLAHSTATSILFAPLEPQTNLCRIHRLS